ncbi:MAG: tetratricopeptide repeat protein, partial [Acidobacteriales bacterium]|nr:tetratricopeptide repeat protein [Terriglobales bacterium]
IASAVVEWLNTDNGRKYSLKTNNKGEYFSLGISPGKYKVTLSQGGKELYHYDGVPVGVEEADLDFDLKKEQTAVAKEHGLTPEQLKQQEEQKAKVAKEANTIKSLNEKLAAAKQASDAGNFDDAIAQLNEATQMDASHDVLWARLADAYRNSAVKQTDPAEKTKRLEAAVSNYEKAIEIKTSSSGTSAAAARNPAATDPNNRDFNRGTNTMAPYPADKSGATKTPAMPPDAVRQLAGYYNNMGDAAAKLGKVDDAVKDYNLAAQTDPSNGGQYYFNLGAVLTNANASNDPKKRQAAIEAFDKAIAADPKHADAYYWKAVNYMGDATLKGDKMVAPEGTAEAFNKYLELQPTGPHAEEAKAMLASIGATIQTEFGKKKSTKK